MSDHIRPPFSNCTLPLFQRLKFSALSFIVHRSSLFLYVLTSCLKQKRNKIKKYSAINNNAND